MTRATLTRATLTRARPVAPPLLALGLLVWLALPACDRAAPDPPVDGPRAGEQAADDERARRPGDDDPGAFRGTPIAGAPAAPDVDLLDQRGRPFRLSDQRGRVVLLFFGFVHCPDVCPATLSHWAAALRGLGDLAEQVRCVFVTVDPERDTPERLAGHLAIYDERLIGLGGDAARLQPIWSGFGVQREIVRFGEHPGSYLVDHSTEMVLVDTEGRQRVRLPFDAPVDDLLHDLRLLLP